MARRFSKRTTRKKTYKLSPKNAEEIIRQEFTDSRGNKVKFKFDFRPHPIDEPTAEWQRKYNKEKE